MTISVRRAAELAREFGYKEFPSGVNFYSEDDGKGLVAVVKYEGEPLPYLFYYREDNKGNLVTFRAIRPQDIKESPQGSLPSANTSDMLSSLGDALIAGLSLESFVKKFFEIIKDMALKIDDNSRRIKDILDRPQRM